MCEACLPLLLLLVALLITLAVSVLLGLLLPICSSQSFEYSVAMLPSSSSFIMGARFRGGSYVLRACALAACWVATDWICSAL